MGKTKTKKERLVRNECLAVGSLITITLLSGIILSSTKASADTDATDTITVTLDSSCTLTGTNTAHTGTITNGIATSNIGETTLKATCNDASGFAIYAIGYTGDTDGNNKLVNTTLGSTADIATGTNTTGNSSWAMKVTTETDPAPDYPITIMDNYDAASYHTVPDDYAMVAKRTTATDAGTSATGSILKTTYQVYASNTQPAGTYTGKVKYVLVHPNNADTPEIPPQPQPSTAGTITYYANAKDAQGTMGIQTVDDSGNDLADNATVTLYASNFSRAGYGFAGWSDAYDYATNANAHFYGPNETITVPEGTTANGLSLYAVWVESAGSLQDATKVATLCGTGTGSLTRASIDGTANLSSVTALTDERDNQTYAIAKLADGNCWMIENLRLESTAAHNSDGILAQGYGTSATYGSFGGLAGAESSNFEDSTTANSLYYSGTQSGDATIDIGTTNYPGYRMPRYNNINTSTRAWRC